MTTVYVVTSGEYENRRNEGVFSTSELAAAYIELHKRLDIEQYCIKGARRSNWEIFEWVLDDGLDDVIVKYWRCVIGIETGLTDEYVGYKRVKGGDVRTLVPRVVVWEHRAECVVSSYVSAEQARELAVEARERVLAQRTVAI